MPIMEWTPALDVGVAEMNREHVAILAAMNAIYDATTAGRPGATILPLIARLADVTTRHFADEEAFMERTSYPDLRKHRLVHQALLTDFAAHVTRIEAAGGVPGPDFFNFLRLWLSAHIKCIDRKYGDHAARRAA